MKMLLAGEWVDRHQTIDVTDPYDGSVVDTVPRATRDDVETAMAAAVEGFEVARRLTTYERYNILMGAAQRLRDDQDAFAT
ncbi:MAG: aldehyde dehydrogenase family protein, partial [Anaerolineae bacterium]